MKKRDFVQKILYQSKRTQPSAGKSPQKAPKQKEKTKHPKRDALGDGKSLLIQQSLQGAYGAGSNCPRAGIAVQARNTGKFKAALIDFSI